MIASAQTFCNGLSRALGEWVSLQVRGLGSIRFPGEGEHGVRPYGKTVFVGATLVVALRSERAFQEVP